MGGVLFIQEVHSPRIEAAGQSGLLVQMDRCLLPGGSRCCSGCCFSSCGPNNCYFLKQNACFVTSWVIQASTDICFIMGTKHI